MKLIIIFIALFGIQITNSFGEVIDVRNSVIVSEGTTCLGCPSLAPVVPLFATFEDQKELQGLMVQTQLTPEIPMEADFEDVAPEISTDTIELSPLVPMKADFSTTL